MQSRYGVHRTTRNSQQKAKLLSPDFKGLIVDCILQRLEDPTVDPGFTDPRHCLVFWARPPAHILSLAGEIQEKLLTLAPGKLPSPKLIIATKLYFLLGLWLMPTERMHLTALEITHSLAHAEIQAIITKLGPEAVAKMTDYTYSHRARLIKPMLSYDGAAIALSFLPAAGESSSSAIRNKEEDVFTYHHLRRDLFAIAKATGVSVDSRYVVPSSHITIGRFLVQTDHDTPQKMERFLDLIEDINRWLEETYYPKEGVESDEKGEWIIGQDKGLDLREGTVWYGGGNSVGVGKGF